MQTVLMVIDRDSAVDSYFRGRNSVIQFGIGASQTLEFPKVMTLAVHSLGGYVWDSNIHEYVKQATMEGKVTLMFSKSRSLQFNWPFTHDAGHAGLMNEILQKGYRFISRAEFLRSFD